MTKEICICIIIVISVFFVDFISTNNTKQSALELEKGFDEIRLELEKDEINEEEINSKMKFIKEKWQDKYEKLAFYIEHDELEKVKTEFTSLKAYVRFEKDDAFEALDKIRFIIRHIEEKDDLRMKNVL